MENIVNLLEDARSEINQIDKEMAELFERRMNAVKKVAEYKIEHGIPVLDKSREKQLADKNSKYIHDDFIRRYYIGFLNDTMAQSRAMQECLMSGMKIAYSGTEGAFAQIAAKKIFKTSEHIAYGDFKSAYEAVENGDCDCVVLPIENSFAGEVGKNIDLIFSGSLYINGIYELKIRQNLLGVEGASLKDIKYVISHPQALEQCGNFIEKHGLVASPEKNTAIAAKMVSEKKDIHTAAIASKETADIYGLNIIEPEINESELNTTRFAVLTRASSQPHKGGNTNFMIVFSVNNRAGALAEALNVIGNYGFSMQILRSRSMPGLLWQYYFYSEIRGDVNTEQSGKMLEELGKYCDKLRVVGTYGEHILLED